MKTGYAIITETICYGPTLAWSDENGDPVLYDTFEKAEFAMIEDFVEPINEFLAGERTRDEIEIQCEDWVERIEIDENNIIYSIDSEGMRLREILNPYKNANV